MTYLFFNMITSWIAYIAGFIAKQLSLAIEQPLRTSLNEFIFGK